MNTSATNQQPEEAMQLTMVFLVVLVDIYRVFGVRRQDTTHGGKTIATKELPHILKRLENNRIVALGIKTSKQYFTPR